MGLLDQFSGMSEDQTQGLLAAAAQMLQQSGPSTRPVGLGQILGGGLSAYQDSSTAARKRKLEEDATKQMAQLRGLQIQDAQGGLQDHNTARSEAERLRQFYMGDNQQTQTQPQPGQGMPTPSAPMMPNMNGPRIAQPDWMPGGKTDVPPMAQPVPALQQAPQFGSYEYLMANAQKLAKAGFVPQAQAMMKQALEARPKFANEPRTVMGPDGKPILVQMADDGTVRAIQGGYGAAEKLEFRDLGGSVVGLNPYTGAQRTSYGKGQTPDSIASNAISRDRLNFDKSQADVGGEVPITGDAISNAAARYNIDGTLPPMGMGKAAAAGRSAILNKAAELAAASGLSGDDQRIAQIGNKANTAALSKLQQQQTMVGAFERNFNKNADIALELSQRVDRTGSPLANRWINAGKRAIVGDPDLTAFDASIKSTSNEFAKIVSGSMGNTAVAEGEIKKMDALLNSAQNAQQVAAALNLMKRETQNRMTAFDEEKASLRASMNGKKVDHASAPSADFSIVAPNGKTYSFSDAKGLANFKLSAGIK